MSTASGPWGGGGGRADTPSLTLRFNCAQAGLDELSDAIGAASTACFLFKFFWALPPGEQAYFSCLPFVFVAHTAWRWRAPRHYLTWRSLSAAFWVLEPLLPRPCWRGWALSTAENALPLLAPGRWWLTRAAGAASLLSLSSLALPLALLGMARPLPALLHLPVQALAVAVLMRRNPETCAAIVLSPQPEQTTAAAAAVAVVRSAHRACSIAASAVTTAALLLAGQPPTRLLAVLQEQPKPSAALAECSTLFAYLQLVFGFACPLLLMAAQEARIYAASASAAAPQQGLQPSSTDGGTAAQAALMSERSCRAWGRDAVQRWLAQQLARLPAAARGSALGGLVAAYLLAALWLGLAAFFEDEG